MNNYLVKVVSFVLVVVSTAGPLMAQKNGPADTARVSAGTFSGAAEPDGASTNARVSKNGRFVVFESVAGNLVTSPSPSPGQKNCYLYDRQADAVEMVSLTTDGDELDADCLTPSVSNDGRYVAFASSATIDQTVSVCPSDFCHVNKVFPGQHIWVRDRLANKTMLISQVSLKVTRQQIDGATFQPVVADSVPPGGKVPVLEVVVKRVAATKVGVNTSTSSNPRISADGQFVVYDTDADNLVLSEVLAPVFPALTAPTDFDSTTGIVVDYANAIFIPLAFYVDNNSFRDVYVRDGSTYTNSLVSLACKFHEPNKCSIQGSADSTNPVISDDGSIIVFSTSSKFLDLDFNNAEDIFVVDRSQVYGEVSKLTRISNNTSRILAGNGASTKPGMSADGRYIAFQSDASNLVSGDTNGKTDIFVFDRPFNRMLLCSKPTSGSSDQNNTTPDISGAGEYVVFQSASTSYGLSSGLTNIYMGTISKGIDGDAVSCSVEVISKGTGTGSAAAVTNSTIGIVPRSETRNGLLIRTKSPSIAYQTSATNLSSESDTNGLSDIFQTPLCTAAELATDTDSDGTSDCFDQCANDPIAVESDDSDADGVADCEDGCSSDPQKVGAGFCGCGVDDTDTDSDGKPDCTDGCPSDPLKVAPGTCGCGIADTDADGNGTADCKDSTNPTPAVTPSTTPTPNATATPTFDLANFTPQAPTVSRSSGSNRIKVTFSTSGVTNSSAVQNYDLIGRRLVAAKNKVKRGPTFRRRGILDGIVKVPSSGKWVFSAVYNGAGGVQSRTSPETRALNIK